MQFGDGRWGNRTLIKPQPLPLLRPKKSESLKNFAGRSKKNCIFYGVILPFRILFPWVPGKFFV
jgi:hypothetical protein